ncbi:hypothetical protein ACIBM8_12435 [Micromonospora aurantiaca]|uniref:SbtR family transcriptional regulator n=1 Tax=Micromonospora TaxID=1873 RepID=UPI0037982538
MGRLLEQAQAAGTVAGSVRLPEVMALLTGMCQGALNGGWDEHLQARTLAVVFAGFERGRRSGADPAAIKPVGRPRRALLACRWPCRKTREVVPVTAVSTWVLPSGVTAGR